MLAIRGMAVVNGARRQVEILSTAVGWEGRENIDHRIEPLGTTSRESNEHDGGSHRKGYKDVLRQPPFLSGEIVGKNRDRSVIRDVMYTLHDTDIIFSMLRLEDLKSLESDYDGDFGR